MRGALSIPALFANAHMHCYIIIRVRWSREGGIREGGACVYFSPARATYNITLFLMKRDNNGGRLRLTADARDVHVHVMGPTFGSVELLCPVALLPVNITTTRT